MLWYADFWNRVFSQRSTSLYLVNQGLLEQFKLEILKHPPFSPDLVPNDYHLFIHMKKKIGYQYFGDEKLRDAATGWLKAQGEDLYADGIVKK